MFYIWKHTCVIQTNIYIFGKIWLFHQRFPNGKKQQCGMVVAWRTWWNVLDQQFCRSLIGLIYAHLFINIYHGLYKVIYIYKDVKSIYNAIYPSCIQVQDDQAMSNLHFSCCLITTSTFSWLNLVDPPCFVPFGWGMGSR